MASTLLFTAKSDRWTLTLKTTSSPCDDLDQLTSMLAARKPPASDPPQMKVESNAPRFELLEQQAFFHVHEKRPCVFENRQYTLWIEPIGDCELVDVVHPVLKEVGAALEQNASRCFGTLRTGNDIGRFTLLIKTKAKGETEGREDRIWWDVWPLKLDYGSDLKALTREVEKTYPLWLYRFLAPTDHEAGRSETAHDRFLLLWLKQFQALRERFEKGVATVLQSPHQRLDEHVRHLRADRIKGKLTPRLEERIAQGRMRPELRYRIESRRSSFDTPENRFVKHAASTVAARLDQVATAIRTLAGDKGGSGTGGVSEGFVAELDEWRKKARAQASAPLFRGVGDFEGLSQESLVLHNRAGYSAVYRCWLELRHYLEFFAKVRSTNIGMRQISELYEVWCFLQVRRILAGDGENDPGLGFEEVAPARRPRISRNALETTLEDGLGAAFVLRHERAGITVRLAHEPVFGKKGNQGVHSFTVPQEPDIVLDATWADGRRLLWIFDAKYRIMTDGDQGRADIEAKGSLVPSDAINQMHRYRDSLILRHQGEKSRPVIGAYALYPGVFERNRTGPDGGEIKTDSVTREDGTDSVNPYADAIREVGIGAFPLVPGSDQWLRKHLRTALGLPDKASHAEFDDPATLLAQENVRIPVTGLDYPAEDVLLAFIGNDRNGRSRGTAYLDGFAGEGDWTYHTRVKGGPDIRRLRKVAWIAVIDPRDRTVKGLRRILGMREVARHELGSSETGAPDVTATEKGGMERYRRLELGEFVPRRPVLEVPGNVGGHWFRYLRKEDFDKASSFTELRPVRQLGP